MKSRSIRSTSAQANRNRLTVWIGCTVMLLLAGCLTSQFAYLTQVGHQSPSAADCGECHVAIYSEWKTSEHARSYSSPDFAAATGGRTFSRCMGCHIPDTVFNGTPRPRSHRFDEGVTCITCHLVDGKMAGPIPTSAAVLPHPVVLQPKFYRSSELCGKCHEGTFKQTQAQPASPSCQQCHMPPVKRKNTQGVDTISKLLVKMEDEAEARRHHFSLKHINAPADWLKIEVEQKPTTTAGNRQVLVRLTSQLTHDVPTGDFGKRRAVLHVIARAADGAIVSNSQFSFSRRLKTALQPKIPWEKTLQVNSRARQIEIEFTRIGPKGSPTLTLGKKAFQLPGEPAK